MRTFRPGLLAAAASISCLPWLVDLLIMPNASAQQLEGNYDLTMLLGMAAFSVTGPLTALSLTLAKSRSPVTGLQSAGIYYLVALPVLSFETFAYSSSVLPGFAWFPIYRVGLAEQIAFSGITSLVIYALYLLILYRVSRAGLAATIVAAALLMVLTMVAFILRLFHG